MNSPPAKTIRIEQLQAQIARIEEAAVAREAAIVSSGLAPLDALLPQGGFLPGTLVEWLADGPGVGEGTLACLAARQAIRSDRALVVIDRRGRFYPPAAAHVGLDLRRLVLVRADTQADQFWAVDQSLRCREVAAVLAWPRRLDARTFRRWQLAAEEGGTLGLLLRPAAARSEPSWAEVRLAVESLPTGSDARRRLRLHLLRCRGPTLGRTLDVEIDHE
ncbi:MAG: ImuA family protein [Thermoguttaceae bacterium]